MDPFAAPPEEDDRPEPGRPEADHPGNGPETDPANGADRPEGRTRPEPEPEHREGPAGDRPEPGDDHRPEPGGPDDHRPDPEAPADDDRSEPVERRLHPVTPLRRAWAPIAILIGWAAHDPDAAHQRVTSLDTVVLAASLTGLLTLAALYGVLTWWYTHFAVTESELRIRTGLLFKRTAHIRLDRIQAVDVTQPLLARVVGVSKLKLDVIGTEDKDELAFLGAVEARALRAELLARAAGFAPGQAREVGEAPVRELLRVAPRQLALSLALSGGPWVALAAAVTLPTGMWFLTHSPWPVLAVGLSVAGVAISSSVGRFVKEYDWTVGESPDGLRIDYGLLDRVHETVPPGRVQTVRIEEPLLWRRRGWVRVELDVAGSSNSLLIPVAPRALAAEVIARILPGVTVPEELSRPPRRARWCVPLWWRGYGLAVSDTVFASRHGLLRRSLSLVPHAKVQSVRLLQGPWMRRHRVADVHVETGANKSVPVRLLDADEARTLWEAQAERSRTGRRTARPDRWMA
ncbi:PH domain-containing protein [Streptomyces sp. JNUCC 64]